MEETGNRYILGKSDSTDQASQIQPDEQNEEERRAGIEEIIAAFGTIDYDPDYDYKEQRRRDTAKLEKLYAEWDQDLSLEEFKARLKPLEDVLKNKPVDNDTLGLDSRLRGNDGIRTHHCHARADGHPAHE